MLQRSLLPSFGRQQKGVVVLGRRKKTTSEPQGRQVRRSEGPGSGSPTFSYYANRPDGSDAPSRQSVSAGRDRQVDTRRAVRRRIRIPLGRLPYWAFGAIVVLCVGKLLYLSTNPKLVVIGKSSVTATYLQPSETYTQFAHNQLSGSIVNHIKPFANVNGVTDSLRQQFPELRTVSLGVPLFSNRPIVYAEVAEPSVILQDGQTKYALGSSGLVLAQLSAIPPNIPVLTDQSGVAPRIGKQILPSSAISFIDSVDYQLRASQVVPTSFVLPQASPYELDVRVQGSNYFIKFNLQGNARLQSGAAIATIRQTASKQPANYIDVRVPGRAYYK